MRIERWQQAVEGTKVLEQPETRIVKCLLLQSTENANTPFVSIVICTYNRKKLLRDCLNSIQAIDYPKSRLEIIVVDGGSNDGTDEFCSEFPEIKFVKESQFGLAYARNKGAKLARGSIVAYTDDDCIVDEFWLKQLVLGFQYSSSIVGVGGPVFPLYPQPTIEKILVHPALGLFNEGNTVKIVQGIITSNSAFKKELFKVMQFDERLGTTRRGKLILSNEDTKFCQTLNKYGYILLYTPFAKVYHQIHNDRLRVPYIVKRAIHQGISNAKSLEIENGFRVWMLRVAVGGLVQTILGLRYDRSFTSCYKIVVSMSTIFVCLTRIDKALIKPSQSFSRPNQQAKKALLRSSA